jgi:hypothetical protein
VNKLFAVTWDALLIGEGNKQIVVHATLQQFENVPDFAKGKWPDAADPDWRAQIHGYYHLRSRGTGGSTASDAP